MLKVTIRNLLDKKIRFALTTLSVVMGVMFVVGVFVLTDSLRATFSDLAEDIAEGTDLTVRASQEIGVDFDRPTLPEELADQVARVDGVEQVLPGIAALNVFISDADGEAIVPQGPPALGFNFSPGQFFLISGREPSGPTEFAVDSTTAADNGLELGETYSINGPISRAGYELVGLFNFGSPDANNSVGQTMAAFDVATAQSFLGFEGRYLEIGVLVASGFDAATVRADLEAGLDPGYEVITPEIAIAEQEDDFNQFINIFNVVLLVFAFIAVFVSAFIINNTFHIVLGQRVRELGLLRAIGATPRQVSRSVVLESALVGVLSTVLGIALGVLTGIGMRALLVAFGFALPSGPVQLQPRTVVIAVIIGMGVTMVSSIAPAIRSRRISPIAAIGTGYRVGGAGLRRRLIGGVTVTAVGAIGLGAGMFADLATVTTLTLIGAGAFVIFIGINISSPAFARPVADLLGRPIQAIFKIPGRIARDNASRSPRRTASTAGALMIGLALVGMTAVVGESIKKSFISTLDNTVEADYFLRSTRAGFDPTAGFTQQVADDLAELEEIDSVLRYRFAIDSIRVQGENKNVVSTDLAIAADHFDADVQQGDIAGADPLTSILLHMDPARDLGVDVGDSVDVTFPDNQTETLTVAAIYANSTIYDNWVIDIALWDRHFNRSELVFASATISGFSDDLPQASQAALLEQSRVAIDRVLESYPTVLAENQVEFRQSQQSQLDSFLIVITLFLALALIIALVGIANTLALSVFERTREIGLLRAVGMTRRQLRRAIRWEAAIVAVFGALLGVLIGVVFGLAATVALPDSFVRDVAIPVRTLALYVVISAVAGLVAAIFPARRAGRMNVLDAIAHE